MAPPKPLSITFEARGVPATSTDIDAWELRAARRALKNLKSLLSPADMLNILSAQMDAGDAYFKSIIAASNGAYRECRTDLHIKGINAGQVQQARLQWLAQGSDFLHQKIMNVHPEHYVKLPIEGESIVEVIGEHMARMRVIPTREVPEFVMEYGDPEYPFKKPTVLKLEDETVLSYILHEFRNTEEGCDVILRLLFPSAATEVWFKEHAEHLAIEFRAGIEMAYGELYGENRGDGKPEH
jgi:hypothetical protein